MIREPATGVKDEFGDALDRRKASVTGSHRGPPPRMAVSWCIIELGSRRVHLAGCTANPSGAWVTQQARQLAWTLPGGSAAVRFLIRDCDSKFTRDFDTVFRSEGVEIIRTPVRAPKASTTTTATGRIARST